MTGHLKTLQHIAALFTLARTWKQPRCPSTDEWIKKLQYIYTMEYYLFIKRNTFESVLMRWMNLEPIIQSEVSQKEKKKQILYINASLVVHMVKSLPAMLEVWVQSLGHEDPLEKEMTTHSSILAWKIP